MATSQTENTTLRDSLMPASLSKMGNPNNNGSQKPGKKSKPNLDSDWDTDSDGIVPSLESDTEPEAVPKEVKPEAKVQPQASAQTEPQSGTENERLGARPKARLALLGPKDPLPEDEKEAAHRQIEAKYLKQLVEAQTQARLMKGKMHEDAGRREAAQAPSRGQPGQGEVQSEQTPGRTGEVQTEQSREGTGEAQEASYARRATDRRRESSAKETRTSERPSASHREMPQGISSRDASDTSRAEHTGAGQKARLTDPEILPSAQQQAAAAGGGARPKSERARKGQATPARLRDHREAPGEEQTAQAGGPVRRGRRERREVGTPSRPEPSCKRIAAAAT